MHVFSDYLPPYGNITFSIRDEVDRTKDEDVTFYVSVPKTTNPTMKTLHDAIATHLGKVLRIDAPYLRLSSFGPGTLTFDAAFRGDEDVTDEIYLRCGGKLNGRRLAEEKCDWC